jgi:hypothetical protein
MATRYTGKDLIVYVNSQELPFELGWTLDWDDSTVERFGVGGSMPEIGELYSRRRGSFEAEGDPSDGVQVSLIAGVTEASLLLHEIVGTWISIPNARIVASQSVTRNGKPMRRYSWIEIPS